MSDNKKYYYLKLKESFFDSDEMIVLESMPDGYLYSNILLKLYLRSLKNEGRLMFNNRIPFNSQMLAQVTRHQVGTVEKAVKIFEDMGLIDIMDNGAIYISDIQNFIGKSSTEADRIRKYRGKIELEKETGVQMLQQKYDKSTPEIELEKELELELEKELESEPKKKKTATKNNSIILEDFGISEEVIPILKEFIDNRKLMKSPMSELAIKKLVTKLKEMGNSKEEQIMILEKSIINGWKGIFPLEEKDKKKLKKDVWKDKPKEIPLYMQEFVPDNLEE